MSFVEIPISSFVYRFRRLTWVEEFAIKFTDKEDQRRTYLTAALAEISGTPIANQDDAHKIVAQIPISVIGRIWVLYKAGLPEDRFFVTGNLYMAPAILTHNREVEKEAKVETQVADRESEKINTAILTAAKKRGNLIRPKASE